MLLLKFLVRLHLWYAGHGSSLLARIFARIHPSVKSLESSGVCWKLETNSDTIYLSDPKQIVRIIGVGVDMKHRVWQKYTSPGFVEVESDDTVIEVGAFIGEFSRPAAGIAEQLVAVEPDERNIEVLSQNLAPFENVSIVQGAAWNETGTRTFNIAGDPSEGSILDVDNSDTADSITLDAIRLDDLAADIGLDIVDFLKVEAEGAEPEVLEGIAELSVEKIAVECAPERDGRSPAPEVIQWLKANQYEIRQQGRIIFARQSESNR